MSIKYYSYYNLVRKPNTAFDCLKSIAVFARSCHFNVQIEKHADGRFWVTDVDYGAGYYFLPLADVYQGVLIRGDILPIWPLTNLSDRAGRYAVAVRSTRATTVVVGRHLEIADKTHSRFTFDRDALTVTLDATFPVSDFATQLQSVFAKDFPNQSVGLPDLDPSASIGGVLTMQGDPSLRYQMLKFPQEVITGDPITAPLQTIDFNTGQ